MEALAEISLGNTSKVVEKFDILKEMDKISLW